MLHNKSPFFKRAQTELPDVDAALADLATQLRPHEAHLTLLFLGNFYNDERTAPAILKHFGLNVIGCSTAGEITFKGRQTNTLCGISFMGPHFKISFAEVGELNNLSEETFARIEKLADKALHSQSQLGPSAQSFALLLVDGLSNKEEFLTGSIASKIKNIPLIGGSSGDNLKFLNAPLYYQGTFKSDRALIVFISTTHPFYVFKTQHFIETDKKIVITDSIPEKRLVTEIDGESASEGYAQALGINVDSFSPMVFSEYPVMLKVGGSFYVRSIQKANQDGTLNFYCAIDNGLVLTLAKKESLLETSKEALLKHFKSFEDIECSIFFECILRRLEIDSMSQKDQNEVDDFYKKAKATGFYTYGEQFGSIHINQTLTGVIFGKKQG